MNKKATEVESYLNLTKSPIDELLWAKVRFLTTASVSDLPNPHCVTYQELRNKKSMWSYEEFISVYGIILAYLNTSVIGSNIKDMCVISGIHVNLKDVNVDLLDMVLVMLGITNIYHLVRNSDFRFVPNQLIVDESDCKIDNLEVAYHKAVAQVNWVSYNRKYHTLP